MYKRQLQDQLLHSRSGETLEPTTSKVFLTDISPKALEVAKENARGLETNRQEGCFWVSEPPVFFHGDGLEPLRQRKLAGELDMIVSNPPYIPRDEIPVSYTHLDVYKRQVVCCVNVRFLRNCRGDN